jgi:hypothetical protein
MTQVLVDPALLAEVCKKYKVDEQTVLKLISAEKNIDVRTHRLKEYRKLLGGEQDGH